MAFWLTLFAETADDDWEGGNEAWEGGDEGFNGGNEGLMTWLLLFDWGEFCWANEKFGLTRGIPLELKTVWEFWDKFAPEDEKPADWVGILSNYCPKLLDPLVETGFFWGATEGGTATVKLFFASTLLTVYFFWLFGNEL